jgi:transglutaminase-like putative cysteine protease
MQGRELAVVAAVLLAIGCRLEIRCATATPLLALVHPHSSLLADLRSPERVRLQPDHTYELLSDSAGNRWSRLMASAGVTTFTYEARIERPGSTDPVVPAARACAVQALPVDTYPLLNPSPYCDTAALMAFAWTTFAGVPAGWGRVQAICDWVHEHIRFDYGAVAPEKTASDTLRDRAGVCRDFAHLAITLCRCLNIPARYCTGYLGYTGIPVGEAPVDFSAWFEVFLESRWHVFDARHNIPRCGRVLIARGRDAADVPFLRSFGAHELVGFAVTTESVAAEPQAEPVVDEQRGRAASPPVG